MTPTTLPSQEKSPGAANTELATPATPSAMTTFLNSPCRICRQPTVETPANRERTLPGLDLGKQALRPLDRTGDELREVGDVGREVDDVPGRLDVAGGTRRTCTTASGRCRS